MNNNKLYELVFSLESRYVWKERRPVILMTLFNGEFDTHVLGDLYLYFYSDYENENNFSFTHSFLVSNEITI
jgi:hypothetical protein